MTQVTHIQFHIGDFLSGVMHMDGAEIGAYTMLIMAHYQAGEKGIPDDDKKLKRITRCSGKVWNRIKDTVLEKFYLEDGFWRHKRVMEEIEKIRAKAGTGRPKQPQKKPLRDSKTDLEKPIKDSQEKNKSLKNKETEKTNHKPITNNHVVVEEQQNIKFLGSLLPDDWLVPDEWGEYAEKRGLNEEQIIELAGRFKTHYLLMGDCKEAYKEDWQATWRFWVSNEVKKGVA
ncbi:MAG: hypothetical protein CL561_00275 [Alphaproteobacteria bacterium]|nr:hypothetical protein [Alphaproteobacteria bacterium]|tara:strand:+ start:737 stop:1426 length:690 start_codon:yes stop_codon:yes gene_type:complete